MKNKVIYIVSIILSLFVGVVGTIFALNYTKESEVSNTNVEIKEADTLKAAIEKIYDAVILIETYTEQGSAMGSGTGFIYKKEGGNAYILTNNHVIDGASKIKITFTNGEVKDAKYLGSDEISDVAVLTIPEEGVKKIAIMGKSEKSELGDTVFTVGSPLGSKYMGSVTKGILSGKDRQITVNVSKGKVLVDVLQTDAVINPGNSGGPLLNINGEVIGITSLKLVSSNVEGMGFALPIENVLSYAEKLEKGEKIERPMLGVSLAEVTDAYALRYYGIEVDTNLEEGAIIIGVEKGSIADKAGLTVGDVIVNIDSEKVKDTASFRYVLYKHSIGDTITISYIRKSKEDSVKVKLTDKLN